jgi:thioredoxin reductase
MAEDVDVAIVGDGPTGLSAALLLEKNDVETAVFGENETPMHKALLLNYLGIEEEAGTPFMQRAREQAAGFGADVREERVESLNAGEGEFTVETAEGSQVDAEYLVLATGTSRDLGEQLDLDYDGKAIAANKDGRTSRENVYAGGWAIRPQKIQAAISVGDGAAIALDIISDREGEPFHDFDVV